MCVQRVSPSPASRSKSLMRMAKYVSSLWVPLQCLKRSEPLKRMAKHASSEWVISQWADQNHWQEWINMCPASELLSVFEQMRTTDKNGWIYFQYVSPLSTNWNHWWEWLNMAKHVFSEWVMILQCLRSEPLIRMTEHGPGCELLSSVWAD